MSLRKLLAASSALVLLGACTPATDNTTSETAPAPTESAAVEQTETERLMAWYQSEFESELARSPISQTYLGMIDDLDAYGRWDEVSEADFRAGLQREADRIRYMNENFDFEALTDQAQVSWRFAEFIAANNAQQGEFWDHGYIFTQFFGPHTGMPTTLIGYHNIANADHAEAFISRLNGMGPILNELTAQADARAEAGVIPPAFAFPVVIGGSQGMITGAPFDDSGEDSPLLANFKDKVGALLTAEEDPITQEQHDDLVARATDALLTSVGPAFENLIATMERHAEMGGGHTNGAWALPEGAAFYESQLRNYTTRNDMTAEQIHQTGLDEVARIHGEMRDIMAQVEFEGSLQDFFNFVRTDEQFFYPDSDEGRQRYLDESAAMIDEVMVVAPEYFGQLPRAQLEVRAVEEYRIESATGAFYEQGSLDGTRPGAYYVNLAHMEDNPTYLMQSLAFHEGAPGHHFQSALAQELENTPMFQRFAWYSAYGEGWALYAENLGKDMGFFTDPYQDFGRLSYEIFRAARLVVDTGIHSMQWTEEEANAYMLENTPLPAGDIANEIRRYIVWPGQAVSYKVGMLTILDLRQRAMTALGDEFDYGEFHDIVLTNGSVPLTLLEDLVDGWIAEKQGGAH
jgi:uncharacterized protein (DUF885 family)